MIRVYLVSETAQVELRRRRVLAPAARPATAMRPPCERSAPAPLTKGLHSSTFRLNVSAFCGIRVRFGLFKECEGGLGGDLGIFWVSKGSS